MTPGSHLRAREARRRFARELALPGAQLDLARAALLIAAEEQPWAALDVESYLETLRWMGGEVRRRLAAGNGAPVAVLNHFMFDEMGFRGNAANYYDPRNSLLNFVLAERTGLPITLSLVYMEVGRHAGLRVEGVGLPGHFIARVRSAEGGEVLVDAFNRTVLDEEDCQERLDGLYGGQVTLTPEHLRAIPPRAMLARILANLKNVYMRHQLDREALGIVERVLLLRPADLTERRDRGLLLARLNRHREALDDLKYYLRKAPAGDETESVREQLKALHEKLASFN